ncbi:MAG TPA: acyltransferase [Candidatus Acidoferrales bacterium]|nr:acyltransferase [Candidatus Acidoferrales bacterium]
MAGLNTRKARVLEGAKRSRLTTRASVHLDMIRGAAAMAVLVGHVRGLFFLTYHRLPRRNAALAAMYAVTGLGHQAVVVFFVLSGFFIVSSVLDSMAKAQWSWKTYLVNRIVRLSLVLAPALVITWIADRAGEAMAASAAFYQKPLTYFFSVSPASLDSLRNFFGNLFYLQGILVQPFGSNGPLWSLSYEFWYYLLFPLLLCAWIKRYRPATRGICLALALIAAWFVGETIAMYFLLWLLGGAIACSFSRQKLPLRTSYAGLLAIIAFVAALALSVTRTVETLFFMDSIVALGFAVWMYVLVIREEKFVPRAYDKTARLFAGFSYTLYAVHFPLLILIRARFVGDQVWAPDWLHFFFGVVIATAALAIAWAIAQVTEAKTAAVRRMVMHLLPDTTRPGAHNS